MHEVAPIHHTDGFWRGRLAATIGEASTRVKEKDVREDLRACLSEFIASPVPSEELRRMLRPYLDGKK